MGKAEKEIPDKKHKIRRLFTGIAIGIGALVLTTAGAVAVMGAQLYVVLEAAAASLGVGVTIGGAVATVATTNMAKISANKKRTTKALNKIRKHNERTPLAARLKNYAKYAKGNIKQYKLTGNSIYGAFLTNTGRSEEETKISGMIESYEVLEAVARAKGQNRKAKKIQNKIKGLSNRLVNYDKINSSRGFSWAQFYGEEDKDLYVYDERTKISCMTSNARDRFAHSFGSPSGKSSKVGCSISIRFPEDSSAKTTYACIEDTGRMETAKNILLQDLVDACGEISEASARRLFPITVEIKNINKNSTKVLGTTSKVYESLTELKQDISYYGSRNI